MKWYGLKRDGKPLGVRFVLRFEIIEVELESFTTNVWLVKNRETAERAAVTDTAWYNSDYDTPINPYIKENLVVFEVEI